MEKLIRLFGRSIRFTYHSFDRIVIRGYLSALSRPENIVYFFRTIKQVECISKETLRQRTDQYLGWVNAYAKNHEIPVAWAEKDVRKKDDLASLRMRRQRQHKTGVYYVLKSMEQGPSFRIVKPKFPVTDPNWRIVAAQRSRYTHLYFYIIDKALGPFSMRIGAFLPFYATYYLNGHDIIAPMLSEESIDFRAKENAFVSVSNPDALQAAADRIDPRRIQERLDYWTFTLGPKFAQHERAGMDLRRYYYINQVEYAHNIVFKRNHPIHSIFERSCDLGLARITTHRIANIFGWRITKRTKGKHQVVLDQMNHGHHVLRAYSKNAFVKQYEKDNTFLRIETCSNNLKEFHQKKSMEYLPAVARKLQAVNNRFADTQAENLNVELDHPLLEKLAQPCRIKSQRMAGIRLENDRIIRMLEVLMHSSSQLRGLSAAQIHQAILEAHQLSPNQYTRSQLAYDLRKLRAHGLIERPDNRYVYALSDYGRKAVAMLVIVRNRILRPIAGSLFERPVKSALKPNSTLQAQYRRTTKSFNDLIALLKAA
jgi:DNA-binding transcriptional ArsR family regulator